ncbi:hypothetical protein JCM4914_19880 [Streptomyces platensis subsp. malvinus]
MASARRIAWSSSWALSGARNRPVASAVTPAAMASCISSTWEKTRCGQPSRGRLRRGPVVWRALDVSCGPVASRGEEGLAGNRAGPEGPAALGRGTDASFSPIPTNSKRADRRAGNPCGEEFGGCPGGHARRLSRVATGAVETVETVVCRPVDGGRAGCGSYPQAFRSRRVSA